MKKCGVKEEHWIYESARSPERLPVEFNFRVILPNWDTSLRCGGSSPLRFWTRASGMIFLLFHILFSFVTTFAAKDIPMYHVTAVQGDPVYMPCNISTSEEGDAVVIVLWYREDLGTPIYTVDTRDRSILQADRWSADNVFSNRAYFMPDKVPAELGVDHVRESDEGVYRCRVDFRKAQTRNTKVNLTVIVPPQKIVILDESHVERTSVVGPYSEGSNLHLKCDVYGERPSKHPRRRVKVEDEKSKPKPRVSWLKDDQEIGQTVSSLGQQIRSEVILKNLERSDLHSELTCQAMNNNRTQPLSSTVHIDMNFPPMDVRILGSTQSLTAGRRYDLLCQSSGSRPPASITWWKDGQRLERTKETTSSDGNTTTSTLSFVVSKDDAGRYLSCRSVNPILSGEPLESGWKLRVQYAPECKIELGKSLNGNAIREGTDVYFDCLVDAEPAAYKVEWRHNGRQLHHNIGQGIIISNQSLVLQGVSRSSAGNYSCVGFNSEGDSESTPFHLNILYAPTCKPNQTRVHGVAKSEKADISCAVDANPAEVTFRWLFNNSAESIDVASSHITKTGTFSMVSYTPRTEMDYGTLLCWAKNVIGDQKVPCVFHIIAAGRPDPVSNCSVANISMTSFSVKCSEGFNGGLPQSFILEVLKTSSQGMKTNTTSPYPRFSVGDLEPGAQYHALVYAFNPKGRSEPVVVQASTLRLPEKQLTSEKERRKSVIQMTPLMTVAAIVGGALLLVAAAIALVLRLQCYRANRKRHKSGQDPSGSPGSKLDQSGVDSGDSDEKNPDVIPQPDTVEAEDRVDYLHKRQCISTIETTSPTRGLLAAGLQGPNPQGYCTLRNGMPLRDMSHHHHHHHSMVGEMSYPAGACTTLPRNHWIGPYPSRLPPQPAIPIRLAQVPSPAEEDPTPETPLMVAKRESTV